MKVVLLILGFLAAAGIVGQLTLGQLILSGHDPRLIKTHQHTGYLTVTLTLLYIVLSLVKIASQPKPEKP